MDIAKAKKIVAALAEGIDPTTGELLPADSIYNKGDIVRALYTVLSELKSIDSKNNLPRNAGKPWSVEDDLKLKVCFDAGMSKNELCAEFERTPGSISSRLVRLGLING